MSIRSLLGALMHGDGEHASGTGSLPGCDVSSFNGPPADWRSQAGRISWAGVKISELSSAGPYVNPDAAQDWSWLRDNGKARIGYLFARPDTSAEATVSLFTRTITALGLDDGDGVAIDLEVSCGRSPREVAAWAVNVASLLEHDLDRSPVVYSFLSFAQEGNCAGLGGYPLWMADPSRPAGHPRVPRPWKTWTFHQFSVSGGLDRDVARFATVADLRAAIGKKQEAVVLKADGKTSLHDLVTPHKISCMHALRLTLDEDGRWPDDLYGWGNDVLSGRKPETTPLPKGTKIVVKKAG